QAGTYSLKHAHEWLTVQPGLFFNYALPHLAIGGPVSGPVNPESLPIDSAGLFSAVGLLVFIALLVRHVRLQKRFILACPESVFVLPLLLLVLALFPSWRLNSAWSYRYAVPFLPGLYLGAVLAIEAIVVKRAMLFGLVGAYAICSGFNCFSNRQ